MQPVLVASTYYLELDPKQTQKMRPFPPLAALYVAAGLREAGHPVVFFDAMLARAEGDFEAALDRGQPEVVVLYDDNFNFLSKMCLTRMREAALRMCQSARGAGAWVVVSGPDMTDHPHRYLAAGAHAVAVGEGDHTVVELVQWRQSGGTGDIPNSILGVVSASVVTAARRNERQPDVFPHPARDLVDLQAYKRHWLDHHGRFTLNMVSTRGCPFHCNWCAKPIWGQRYAMRSARDVAEEMADIKTRFSPDELWFADDIFGLRDSWLAEFADEIELRDGAIPFSIQSRCDLMSERAVGALRRAGCAEVWLGAESGSQRILDAMDKGITVEEIREARARLRQAGIRAAFFVQFGYPGEDLADIWATITLLRETLPDNIGVSVSYPLPGTRFHAMVADQLADKVNWEDSGDLDMMFSGTFSTAFYRHLHTALHDDLHLHRRLAGMDGAPALSLDAVSLPEHRTRVDAAWARMEALALTERLRRPTLLVRSEPVPAAPDLSRTHG